MRASTAGLLAGLMLALAGCGKEIIPIPVPCPACEETAESACSYTELDDGTKIRTQYTPGDPNLPLVIGVHGIGGTYNDVSIIFPAGSFSTISFSLPGSICSDLLPAGTVHTVGKGTDTLEKVIEHHRDTIGQFGERNVLIAGASYGGFVVTDYFARHPDSAISAVVIAGQDTPLNNDFVDFLDWYFDTVSFLFPLTDNTHLQEYLASTRVFDVSEALTHTRNRWLVIGLADDTVTNGSRAMASRLGERARYAEVPGDHMSILAESGNIRQIVVDHLDFLLRKDAADAAPASSAPVSESDGPHPTSP